MKILHIGCHNGRDHVFDFCKKNKEDVEKIILVDANIKVLKQAKEIYYETFGKEIVKIYNLAILPINLMGQEVSIFQPKGQSSSTIASVRGDFVSTHCKTEIEKTHTVKSATLNKILETEEDVTHLFLDIEGLDVVTLFNTDIDKFNSIKQIIFECLHSDGIVKMGRRLDCLVHYLKCFGYTCELDETEYNMKAFRK